MKKIILLFCLCGMISCNESEEVEDNASYEAARKKALQANVDFWNNEKKKSNNSSSNTSNNTFSRPFSQNGILYVPQWINVRTKRAQVLHTRNGYHPAFDVSGVKGVGTQNGFQWINYGKNESGIYRAGKPLSEFTNGKIGGAVWLITGDARPPFAADGNIVVSE